MNYDFIEIGTSFFNTRGLNALPDEKGIIVEPVKPALDKIPTKPNVKKLHLAVAYKTGTCSIRYIKPAFWDSFPRWVLGCVSVDSLHPRLIELKKVGKLIDEQIQEDVVKCITLSELFDIYNVTKIGELKVDTEGMDYLILQPYFRNKPKIKPDRVIFEANVLTPEVENLATIKMFQDLGYKMVHRGRDVIVERCQQKKKG